MYGRKSARGLGKLTALRPRSWNEAISLTASSTSQRGYLHDTNESGRGRSDKVGQPFVPHPLAHLAKLRGGAAPSGVEAGSEEGHALVVLATCENDFRGNAGVVHVA